MVQYEYKFEVTGKGSFPLDMLRYDSCWPRRQEDVSTIEHAVAGYVRDWTVQMVSNKAPTDERWHSFPLLCCAPI